MWLMTHVPPPLGTYLALRMQWPGHHCDQALFQPGEGGHLYITATVLVCPRVTSHYSTVHLKLQYSIHVLLTNQWRWQTYSTAVAHPKVSCGLSAVLSRGILWQWSSTLKIEQKFCGFSCPQNSFGSSPGGAVDMRYPVALGPVSSTGMVYAGWLLVSSSKTFIPDSSAPKSRPAVMSRPAQSTSILT